MAHAEADRYAEFRDLTFEDFRRRAADDTLSDNEKIGFPDEYREGKERAILADILAKLPGMTARQRIVMDIGPGCGALARAIIGHCRAHEHTLLLADSAEMLARLPDGPGIRKVAGRYPAESAAILHEYNGAVAALLAYSVLHYVFAEGNVFDFVDRSLALLAPGGRMLIGDVPNASKRRRFFSSAAGIRHHQAFTGTNETPVVSHGAIEAGQIDDGAIVGILMRARAAGFDAYVVPQPETLPMHNRREDLLICRP